MPEPNAPSEHSPPQKYASLELVLEEFHLDAKTQQDRAAQLDARGGVLIGFAGVLVGLIARGTTPPSGLQQAALVCAAAAAAAAAVGALWRQASSTLDPLRLRAYMAATEEHARLRILDTRISLYLQDQKRLRLRFAMVGSASALLMAALILLCLAAVR
ncbi:hypothetical protein [Streptomyces gardneri]|uniref:hypothetical protein n=1 Tax=Streptomyces gardneri TaxID=66892 RepID=UPI0036B3BDA8